MNEWRQGKLEAAGSEGIRQVAGHLTITCQPRNLPNMKTAELSSELHVIDFWAFPGCKLGCNKLMGVASISGTPSL